MILFYAGWAFNLTHWCAFHLCVETWLLDYYSDKISFQFSTESVRRLKQSFRDHCHPVLVFRMAVGDIAGKFENDTRVTQNDNDTRSAFHVKEKRLRPSSNPRYILEFCVCIQERSKNQCSKKE